MMTNNEFKEIFKNQLTKIGFKMRGNNFRLKTSEIETIVNLQKSNFSNAYYVNYGYNLLNFDCSEVYIHISERLPQLATFDLEKEFQNREKELLAIINQMLIPEITKIKTEQDVLNLFQRKPYLNMTTIFKVKEYLKLL
ncbi:DUF4304 domain-containing protein [Flavobacterium sp. P21]|uniref:DUF4304 domain-containing protein n=1 Tax=Flavobacterium sp. P21 TaxID=3423948 RepID=UPI003D67F488